MFCHGTTTAGGQGWDRASSSPWYIGTLGFILEPMRSEIFPHFVFSTVVWSLPRLGAASPGPQQKALSARSPVTVLTGQGPWASPDLHPVHLQGRLPLVPPARIVALFFAGPLLSGTTSLFKNPPFWHHLSFWNPKPLVFPIYIV